MIYSITCNITGEMYVGSTKQSIPQRMRSHRTYNNKCLSKKITDRGDYHVKTLEKLINPTKFELLMKEKEYMEKNICINKMRPIISQQEKDEYSKEYKIRYCSSHIEHIIEYSKTRYIKHKDIIKEKSQLFYEKNKITINEKNRQVIVCECGKNYTFGNRLRHKSSKEHTKLCSVIAEKNIVTIV